MVRINVWAWSVLFGIGAFVASLPVGLILVLLFDEPIQPGIEKLAAHSPWILALMALTAPFYETFVGQWLPVWLTGFLTKRDWIKIVVSSLFFAALHLMNSIPNAIGIALVAGPILAFTYIYWRRESFWKAYWAATLTHFYYNLCGVLILVSMS